MVPMSKDSRNTSRIAEEGKSGAATSLHQYRGRFIRFHVFRDMVLADEGGFADR